MKAESQHIQRRYHEARRHWWERNTFEPTRLLISFEAWDDLIYENVTEGGWKESRSERPFYAGLKVLRTRDADVLEFLP